MEEILWILVALINFLKNITADSRTLITKTFAVARVSFLCAKQAEVFLKEDCRIIGMKKKYTLSELFYDKTNLSQKWHVYVC